MGLGIKQNDDLARFWLRKAISGGDENSKELLDIIDENVKVETGFQFGNCLLCGRPVEGDLEHGYLPFRQRCDGSYTKGNALFCSKCKSFVHDLCAKQSFWGQKKCPVCETKLIKTGDGGFKIF